MLSLIVPVYKNAGGITALLATIVKIHRRLDGSLEAVFVVDGSPDASFAQLREGLNAINLRAQLINLSRNFGSFAAIRCGLASARGDTFAVMAADLQEPPELIIKMQGLLATQQVDVVVGRRLSRADAWASSLASNLFWSFYRKTVIPDMPPGGVDIFACNDSVRKALLRLEEQNSSLVAQLFWVGYRRAEVPYERRAREHGVSAWTLRRKLRYLADSIFSFSDLPLRVLTACGLTVCGVSGLFAAIVVLQRLWGVIEVSGYAAIILGVVFFGALNLTATGLVGAYAWRTFENSKRRPLHLVQSKEMFAHREDLAEQ